VAVVDSRAYVVFASSSRSDTCWLELTVPTDAVPYALLDALAGLGWVGPDPAALRSQEALRVEPQVDSGDGRNFRVVGLGYREVRVTLVGPPGVRGDWTVREQQQMLASARAVLHQFGVVDVPLVRKTWQQET
jgi:hypothetical protein